MEALDMLGVLQLPEDLIDEVRGMLGRNADELEQNNVNPIGAVFGGSEAGAQLGHHSSVAQQHVAKAVLQMAAGLRGYRDNLSSFTDNMVDTDVSNATALNGIAESTSCVAAPSFETNNSCSLPLSTEGD
ncbi:hypothetical protein [Nocardioides aquiterrae]|uniref:WXG100 family type VII secretion target n=1 Tax=Nocardioides aquiterrae TaxID=203799 RepID=A0ABP4EX64_9ACTN